MKNLLWLLAMLALAIPALGATATLLDQQQLQARMEKSPPCCIIDARSTSKQKQDLIAAAVLYKPGFAITPTPGGYALVVADTDAAALKLARQLSAASGQDVVAIKGGYATWAALAGTGEATNQYDPTAPRSFTIPRNTCEQGKPLRVYDK